MTTENQNNGSPTFGTGFAATYPRTEPCDTGLGTFECLDGRAKSPIMKTADQEKGAAALIGEKADQAVEAMGAGLETVGRNIREHAPEHGVISAAGHTVGEKLEAGGHYLEEHGLTGIATDVTDLIRRNPIPLLLCGLGIGFFAARMVRR